MNVENIELKIVNATGKTIVVIRGIADTQIGLHIIYKENNELGHTSRQVPMSKPHIRESKTVIEPS